MTAAADDRSSSRGTGASGEPAGPRFYGRRRGKKLRPGLERLVAEVLPRVRVTPPADGGVLDVAALFPHRPTDLRLEIGFGGGEHLAAMAAAHPEAGVIGCEPFINGVASLLREIEQRSLENVRIFDEDARLLLPQLPDAAFSHIYLLYNDPWPKTRHHRRRLVQTDVLDAFARLLADGGTFFFASDHAGYVGWTLRRAVRHPDFEWTGEWRRPPADWPGTRYEAKALRRGARPAYLTFRRRPR